MKKTKKPLKDGNHVCVPASNVLTPGAEAIVDLEVGNRCKHCGKRL